ncbi:MAG: hypothetical protein HamCj_07680 [Candidatus Hamiltonella defensa (Ceratovacuna japonica)]
MPKKDADSDGPSVVEKKDKDWKHSGGKSEKRGGVVLSVPKVLLHRHTRQYSLDNRMLYRVWLFRAKSHR